jgi:putative transcriptional regulator
MNADVREKLSASVGEYISSHRKLARLTQTELAAKLEVTRQTVAMLEAGRQLPSFALLYRLAETFNVEVSGLLPTRKEVR